MLDIRGQLQRVNNIAGLRQGFYPSLTGVWEGQGFIPPHWVLYKNTSKCFPISVHCSEPEMIHKSANLITLPYVEGFHTSNYTNTVTSEKQMKDIQN